MKIFVSAAEISSDLQAEKILRELLKLYPPGTVKIAGIGGPKIRALRDFEVVEKAENLRAMGFTEVLGKLFKVKKILDQTILFLREFKPDLILTFDYPDFHFALLKACTKVPELAQAKKICGIPPKIWVWRSKRIELIRKLYDAVWVIFPFEKKLYEDAGIPVIFAGNPLIAEIIEPDFSTEQNLNQKNLNQKEDWLTERSVRLAVMPGSREAEIKAHLKIIPSTLRLLALKSRRNLEIEVPIPSGVSRAHVSQALVSDAQISYRFITDGSREVLARNSLGLIKSGTSTLEAAVLGCVPVIFYRVSFITRLIFQFLVRYSGAVGLPNILLGVKHRKDAIFPEFLGPEATPEALSEALLELINDKNKLSEKKSAGETLKSMLVPGEQIAKKIAKEILSLSEHRFQRRVERKSHLRILVISWLWSTLNHLRRKLYGLGWLPAELITMPSVLVGNLQAGGAGKTPIVITIAQAAVARGLKVGVISRAYGSKVKARGLIVSQSVNAHLKERPEVVGDEPAEILNCVPEVTLGLGSDRVQIAEMLKSLGINFLIFDDGFQNLKFKASITILAVSDARADEVVYRDFYAAAKNADIVLQTKGLPRTAPVSALPIKWEVDDLPNGPIWLLCGVADPDEVVQFYRNLGVNITRVVTLPDHAKIDVKRVKELSEHAKLVHAELAMTKKDWVKVKSDKTLTVFVLRRKISSENWLDLVFKR